MFAPVFDLVLSLFAVVITLIDEVKKHVTILENLALFSKPFSMLYLPQMSVTANRVRVNIIKVIVTF